MSEQEINVLPPLDEMILGLDILARGGNLSWIASFANMSALVKGVNQ